MSLEVEIKFIKSEETLSLRQKVLRPNYRVQDCVYPEDLLATTFHMGVFHHSKLVSIASFMLESHREFSAGYPYRLRGMATDESYRGQGFGSILLRQGIEILRERKCDLLWCNARIRAFAFYQSIGFEFCGDLFEIPDVGPHKVMYKRIIPR